MKRTIDFADPTLRDLSDMAFTLGLRVQVKLRRRWAGPWWYDRRNRIWRRPWHAPVPDAEKGIVHEVRWIDGPTVNGTRARIHR